MIIENPKTINSDKFQRELNAAGIANTGNQAEQQTGKEFGAGHGHVGGYEYNDRQHRFWATEPYDPNPYYVYVPDKKGVLIVPAIFNIDAGMLMTIRKVVGDAVGNEKVWQHRLSWFYYLMNRKRH